MIGRVQYIGTKLFNGLPHRIYIDRLSGQIWRAIDSEVLKKYHEEQARLALLRQQQDPLPDPNYGRDNQ